VSKYILACSHMMACWILAGAPVLRTMCRLLADLRMACVCAI